MSLLLRQQLWQRCLLLSGQQSSLPPPMVGSFWLTHHLMTSALCWLSDLQAQCLLQPFPRPVELPLAEVIVHRAPWGQVVRQHTPRAVAAQHVEYSIDEFASINLLRTSTGAR